jgi:DNA-directed RNA polymerase subunit K/omega
MDTILLNEHSAGGTTCMDDTKNDFNIDDVARKVGGRFKLTVLVQKRYKELNEWSLETGKKLPRDIIDAILREIWQGAIELQPEPDEISAEKLLGGE